ncbi:MAG: ABC transporter permease [Gemmatimonadetes bacterium]|nr:ABC transporter permease [Gemmatimonadota bacterium]
MLQGIGSDVRYVMRALRHSPGFTLVAVLSLALGIGANTAMFGVVRTLLLTPLPVRAPHQLRLIAWRRDGKVSVNQIGTTEYLDPTTGSSYSSSFSYPVYRAMRDAAPDGAQVFAFAFLRGVGVALGDRPAFLAGGAFADGRYFSTLGVPMALGRPLTDADDTPDAPLTVVLSHSFWMRAFGGDPSIVGRTVRVNGTPAEVVGVTARGFKGLSMGGFFPQTEVTLPLAAQPRVYPRMSDEDLFTAENTFWLRLMARVPVGTPDGPVEQELQAVMRSQPSALMGGDGYAPVVHLMPGDQGAQPIRGETARLIYILTGVVGIVLLIACVNLASLMLARGVSRQREMAVRRALGGGRTHLVRQIVLESLALAGAGTAVGLVITMTSRSFLGTVLTGSLGSGAFGNAELSVGVDPLVIGISVALGVAATLLFGLIPALRLTRLDPMAWLKDRAAGASNPRLRFGRMLIAVQVAVSLPLVVGAGLFLETVHHLAAVPLGFDPTGLVEFKMDPGYTRRGEAQYAQLYVEVLSRLQQVPGVRSATVMENALMSGVVSNTSIEIDGVRHMLYKNAVGPGFVETLGMRLLEGRVPGLQDTGDAPMVAAVNQAAVKELFGGASPVGQMLHVNHQDIRIVGVVNDVPYRNQRAPVPPTLYDSALQRNGYGGDQIVLRTDASLALLEPAVREAVSQIDPDLPVPELRTQAGLMAESTARERVFTQLLTVFGAFALLLASIGLHGVTSYSVTRRTSEIGVRVAVGAQPGQILWMVLRQVVALAGVGLLLGIPVALATGPLVQSLLYGVAPTDLVVVTTAALVMLVVAVAAGLLPARRASRLDALVALRTE